jgi:hypothetical protein
MRFGWVILTSTHEGRVGDQGGYMKSRVSDQGGKLLKKTSCMWGRG